MTMDCLTFIASIIESLAWPVAAVVLVLLLKDELVKVAPFIKRLKAGPVEAEFERGVEQLRESAPIPPDPTAASSIETASKNFLFQLAELHPRSAVLESWIRLEAAARAALPRDESTESISRYIPAARLPEELIRAGIIAQHQVTLFHELRRLRNDVAHLVGLEPTTESVRSYIELASLLQSYLEARANDV